MEFLLYLVLGALVAAFGTLIGAGGGIIFVPLFLFMFPWSPAMITGTSLAIVFCNAASGTVAYMRQKRIHYQAAVLFAVCTLPGAILGAILTDYFSGALFKLTFGSFLTLLSLFILWQNRRKKATRVEHTDTHFAYSKPLGCAISFVVGFISSIFGIGGGVIHVPAMIYLLGFPTHIATATSHFVLAVSALFGVATHAVAGHIHWPLAIIFGLGSIVGAQIGARLAKRVQGPIIINLLALALLLLGLRLVLLV